MGLIADEQPALAQVIKTSGMTHGKGMQSYLTMMAVRLMEMQRVLKPTGSIYLHCDPTASHYLKLLMDAIFGQSNFRSEITGNGQQPTVTADKAANSTVEYATGCFSIHDPNGGGGIQSLHRMTPSMLPAHTSMLRKVLADDIASTISQGRAARRKAIPNTR